MRISFRKTIAICKLKILLIFTNKSILLGPIFAIGFTILFKNILPIPKGITDSSKEVMMIYLNLGVIMNTLMTGLMASSLPLAEEKEKHTLRVLMTSSINGSEFLIGSLLPVFVLTELVNLILIPICGVVVSSLLYYGIVTSLGVLISMFIGVVLGLVGKDQTSTSLMMTPIMIIMLLPSMLGNITDIAWLSKISQYTYTGAITKILSEGELLNTGMSMLICIVWLVVTVLLFSLLYTSNRVDKV